MAAHLAYDLVDNTIGPLVCNSVGNSVYNLAYDLVDHFVRNLGYNAVVDLVTSLVDICCR